MTAYAIQAGATRTNPNSGPDGIGVQADIAYTLEARAEVQSVYAAANDNRPVAVTSNLAVEGEPLRFLSVCSGIEAASVAWGPLGWKAVAFAEIEKFPSAVLAHHYPDVPNLGDFTKIDTTKLGRVDILCGGTPCQAFSVAGQRRSLDDARGNLTLAFVELAHELANGNGLRNVIWENVPGVLSTKDNAFGCFLGGLVGADAAIEPPTRGKWGSAGLVAGPKGRAAWRVCDAQYWGVAQRRRRVIVVADFGNGADPAEVLFEREGVQRHSAPSREARKDIAPTISARTKGGGGLGTDFDLDGGLVEAAYSIQGNMIGRHDGAGPAGSRYQRDVSFTLTKTDIHGVAYTPEIARCDATREGSSQDYETTTMVAVGIHGEISHTLKAEGADASEDGTGRGTPIVAFQSKASASQSMNPSEVSPALDVGKSDGIAICFTAKDYGGDAAYDVSPTLRAGGHSGSHANAGVMPAVAFAENSRAEVRLEGGDGQTVGCIGAGGGKPGQGYPAVLTSAVRRLTPVECERLQGFPDNYTLIPVRKVSKANQQKAIEAIRNGDEGYKIIDGEAWVMSPDGPRYKALGNSWAVPLFAWLGRRIDMHMPRTTTVANDNKEAARAA